jgi:ABC-2 type transport system permease protein
VWRRGHRTSTLPDWALAVSPLCHVPNITAASPDWTGFACLVAIAAASTVVGFIGFRRRDVF